jgi:cell division protein FtsB
MKRVILSILTLVLISISLMLNIHFYNVKRSNNEDQFTNINSQINNLRSENQKLRENITELTTKTHTIETVSRMEAENENSIRKLYQVIENLPGVSKKMAFIKEIRNEDKHYLVLDYVNWFSGDDAIKAAQEDNDPNAASLNNGFYIRNKHIENDKVLLGEHALIYVLEGAQNQYIEFNKFITEGLNRDDRLFNILFVGENITLLEEQYRP